MPRIRSIKPEFWDSPGTSKASPYVRLLFIAMWNWADDWGTGDANAKRLLGFAFPSDGDSAVQPRNFRHLAAEVADCFGVDWYSVDGRDYYAIPSWEKHQRTEKRATRRNPTPDQGERWTFGEVSEIPRLSGGTVPVGTGEQGNRGTGEQVFSPLPSSHQRDDEFGREIETTTSPETVFPRGWTAPKRALAYALDRQLDLKHEAHMFAEHARANGRTAVDWDAAFMTWLGRAKPRPRDGVATGTSRAMTAVELGRQMQDAQNGDQQ